jgi:hypothetical protein
MQWGPRCALYELDPPPRVAGDLHNLARAHARANEPNDMVVAAQDWISGLAVTVLKHFLVQVRLKLYRLWHNGGLLISEKGSDSDPKGLDLLLN